MNKSYKSGNSSLIPSEVIENNIFLVRGLKIMFDKDMAKLYGIHTKNFNKAVNRN